MRGESSTSKMSFEEAERLLGLAREVHWSYPTSQGRPVLWDGTEERVERLGRDRGSFVDAVAFLMQNGREDLAVEIAAACWRLWVVARDDQGGREFLAIAIDKGARKPTRARALALYGDSLLAFRQGNVNESRKRCEEALNVAESLNDAEALVLANLAVSRVAFENGNYEQARYRAREARRNAHGLDPAFGQAPLFMEAQSTRMLRDYENAALLFTESLELNRKLRDKGMVIAELNSLGLVEIHRNNVEVAERLFDECEKIASSESDDPYGQGMVLLNRAMVAYRRADLSQARSSLLKTQLKFEGSGIRPAKDDQSEIDWLNQELT